MQIKKLALATLTVGVLGLAPLMVQAANDDLGTQLTEVRQESSIWTVIALDRHLNPFGIDVDVNNGIATLTGSVDTEHDRDLAAQLAQDTEGVKTVNNQLKLTPSDDAKQQKKPGLLQQMDDATITAVIKSKLLWNSHTEGLDINVTTEKDAVTLKGDARSGDAKELAGHLAANTEGVRKVNNLLGVSATDSTSAKVQKTADNAGTVINDTWITSKVKSSFIYDSQLEGLDISVATESGMVRLSGIVSNTVERELAIDTARNIRGVRGVDAGALRVDS